LAATGAGFAAFDVVAKPGTPEQKPQPLFYDIFFHDLSFLRRGRFGRMAVMAGMLGFIHLGALLFC